MQVAATSGLDGLRTWEDQLEALADEADALAAAENGRPKLQQRINLASRGFSLLFLALSPEVIAASCRATAQLGEQVLAGVPELDQQLRDGRAVRRSGLAKVAGMDVEMPKLELPGEVEPEPAEVPAAPEPEPEPAPEPEPEPEPAAVEPEPEPEPAPAPVEAPAPDDLPPAEWISLAQLAEATGRTPATAIQMIRNRAPHLMRSKRGWWVRFHPDAVELLNSCRRRTRVAQLTPEQLVEHRQQLRIAARERARAARARRKDADLDQLDQLLAACRDDGAALPAGWD